ncbi:MAG: glycosyltransferase family 9 protein, partial [Phycisphaerales bacterium]|nr:glycosyltransferase family 9 protein [Phycisphaerales bacterium]
MTVQHDPRILLIRPSALGDVLRSVPVAVSIKKAFPSCTLDWVVQNGFEDAVRSHPAVNEVIAFPRRELAAWWRSPRVAARTWRFFRGLRRGYDLAIDVQGLGRSGLMLLASRGTRRVGFARSREFAWIGANERYRVDPTLNAVDLMLGLLDQAGIPPVADLRLHVPPDAEEQWQALRGRRGLDGSYVALAPTSRWPTKAWPAEWWGPLARHLLDGGLDRVVLLGAPGEKPILQRIAADAGDGVEILAGPATVGVSMAAVRDARLVVANDSAMLHAAAGFDVPLLGLFGPTDPAISGPHGRLADTLRAEEAGVAEAHYRDRGLDDRLMRAIPLE